MTGLFVQVTAIFGYAAIRRKALIRTLGSYPPVRIWTHILIDSAATVFFSGVYSAVMAILVILARDTCHLLDILTYMAQAGILVFVLSTVTVSISYGVCCYLTRDLTDNLNNKYNGQTDINRS